MNPNGRCNLSVGWVTSMFNKSNLFSFVFLGDIELLTYSCNFDLLTKTNVRGLVHGITCIRVGNAFASS
jgi:hypothetical protein